jgi:hypothetical protein
MLRKMFGYGMVGLLAVALIGGTVYVLGRPVEAQAGQGLSGDQGQSVALQSGNGRRGGGSVALDESDGDYGSVGQGLGQSAGQGRGASASGDATQGSGRGQGQGQTQGAGTGPGAGGAVGAVDWETVTGQVTVVDSEMVVQTAEGEVVVGLGQAWYREEAEFVLSVGDEVSVIGFYEDGEFKAGSVENLTTGQTLALRDEDGRPMWAGQGERKSQGQMSSRYVGNSRGGGGGNGTGPSTVTRELDEASQAALIEAVEEEYRALATYEAIMDQFGTVQPFVSVARSEERHVESLVALFDRYGLDVPAVPEFEVPEFDSLQDACAAGVQAEIADAALYDRLFEVVTAPDIVRVFTNLQNASLDNHLPAFEACAE